MSRLTSEMSSQLITISWDRSLASARRLMEKHKIRHLPVTNAEGEIYALLSLADLARSDDPDASTVSGFAPKASPFVDEQTNLSSVAERMIEDKVSAVLVTRESRVLGIVTTEDLLRAFVRLSRREESSRQRLLPLVGELLRELAAAGV